MELKIEYLPVGKLKPYEKNTRKHADHDVDEIVKSIKKYGFSDPIGVLDAQRSEGKSIFGGGFLISEKAAAEKAAATKWTLSEREWQIIKSLGKKKGGD